MTVRGSTAKSFAAFRTTEDEKDYYASLGGFAVKDGGVIYDVPGGSVTTFLAGK